MGPSPLPKEAPEGPDPLLEVDKVKTVMELKLTVAAVFNVGLLL